MTNLFAVALENDKEMIAQRKSKLVTARSNEISTKHPKTATSVIMHVTKNTARDYTS